MRGGGQTPVLGRRVVEGVRGQPAQAFPYGGARARRGACNSGKPHLMQKLFGPDASLYTFDMHYNSPRLNQQSGFLAKTGEYAGCASETACSTWSVTCTSGWPTR